MPGLEWSWQKRPTDPDDRQDQVIDELRGLIIEAIRHPTRRRLAVNLALKKLRDYKEELLADKTVEAYKTR
jgi:uncharacterized coiled-coil protein SlyX